MRRVRWALCISYSTMLNAMQLVNGSNTARAQGDDVVPREIDPETFEIPPEWSMDAGRNVKRLD